MFLNKLEGVNKEGFLKICVHAALSNDIFSEEEKEILEAYCREMNIEVHVPEISETFDEVIQGLSLSASKLEKNIIVLETLALVKADGIFDEKEQSFMRNLTNGLGVSMDRLSKYLELLDKYIEIGKEMYTSIAE